MSIKDVNSPPIIMKCPLCQSDDVVVSQKILEIPHFSNMWLIHIKCNNCGYKHNDMINLDIKEPMRYIYHAENKNDYTTKIVRSANATIRIPRIGAIIEPGPSATGFINNIEGILQDIKQKAEILLRDAETAEQKKKIHDYINKLDSIIEKNSAIDIIIEDPFGNSAIIPFNEGKLQVHKLTEEEVKKLKTGYIIFSMS